jgi:hypothetical protein
VDEAFHAFFVFIALLALNSSFVLPFLTVIAIFGGGLLRAFGYMGWCFHSLKTSLGFYTGA